MNENIIPSLKLVYKPLIMYYGEWELLSGLEELALDKKGKNLFTEFLDRYYYMPLTVIFKDEQLARSFKYAICSRLGDSGRTLYFSKKAFLRNVISNADELVDTNGEDVYQEIKKAIRVRKDVYRDVDNNGDASVYYEEIKNEYINCELDITLEEYVTLCKKKYTKLLSGYNAVLDLFDKSINVDKFIKCFDVDRLYLHTVYSLLQHSKNYFEAYGKLDYNVVVLDGYKEVIEELRKKDSFYNSYITLDNTVYTVDDLFKEYDDLVMKVNQK